MGDIVSFGSTVDVRVLLQGLFAAAYMRNFAAATWILAEMPFRERQRAVDLLLIDVSHTGDANDVAVWLVRAQHASLTGPTYDSTERQAIVDELGRDRDMDILYRRISHGPLVAAVAAGNAALAKWLVQKAAAAASSARTMMRPCVRPWRAKIGRWPIGCSGQRRVQCIAAAGGREPRPDAAMLPPSQQQSMAAAAQPQTARSRVLVDMLVKSAGRTS